MWVKTVLIFAAPVQICSGCAVQDSKVPKYSRTVTADRAEQDIPALTSSNELRMLQHGAEEVKVISDAPWLLPSWCFSKGEEENSSWHGKGARERMRKRGAEGELFKLQSRGMETFSEDKRSAQKRQQLVQEKVQNESAEERWHYEESKKLNWNLYFFIIPMNHKKPPWASPSSSQITSWLISLLP